MLERVAGYLQTRTKPAASAAHHLEERGYAVLSKAFSPRRVSALRRDISRVFDALPPDRRLQQRPITQDKMFRYEMLNRSSLSQRAIEEPAILDAIEPLLGEDCNSLSAEATRRVRSRRGRTLIGLHRPSFYDG